jgi:hypothetical protein
VNARLFRSAVRIIPQKSSLHVRFW